jgi:Asp-tRNA(Asn)/Glu-tRNA(Gln) amidotransferase A subunit family amidase
MTDGPLDTQLDRRAFLAAATAVAAGGAIAARPRTAVAAPVPDLDDLPELTLAQAATAIRDRKLSSEELVQAHLDRIAAFDAIYMAFNTVLAEQALARARMLDRKRSPVGVLHGVPVVVKDNYWTKGVETTANSYIFQGFVPDEDATCVARLLREGAVILGKTQMGPLATTRATTPDGLVTTVNAWTPNTPAYDPGGSSSGSATTVAGRMACSSIGTQTGGSITSPSNQQGLTGLKPTMGRTSLYGVIPLTDSRDHAGPLARDALDAAIMTEVLAGPDPKDPRTQGLPRVPDLVRAVEADWRTTLGVPPGYVSGTSATARARAAMLAQFEALGVTVKEVALPAEWDLLTGNAFNNVRLPERSEPFLPYLKQDLKLFGVSLNSWMQGLFLSGDEWITGQRAKHVLMQRVLDDVFRQCDAVIRPGRCRSTSSGCPRSRSRSASSSTAPAAATCRSGRSSATSRTPRIGCWPSSAPTRRRPTGSCAGPPTRPPRSRGAPPPTGRGSPLRRWRSRRSSHAVVVEPQQLDHVADVLLGGDPPRAPGDLVGERRVRPDPALCLQLRADLLGEAEVGGPVAVQVADLAAAEAE